MQVKRRGWPAPTSLPATVEGLAAGDPTPPSAPPSAPCAPRLASLAFLVDDRAPRELREFQNHWVNMADLQLGCIER